MIEFENLQIDIIYNENYHTPRKNISQEPLGFF